jgi:hypothetical protein
MDTFVGENKNRLGIQRWQMELEVRLDSNDQSVPCPIERFKRLVRGF